MFPILVSNAYMILEDIVLPIFICVVLPCVVVYLIMRARRHSINRKAEIALKAIESGNPVDPNLFASPSKTKSRKEKLFSTLKGGIVCAGIGIGFLACSYANVANGFLGQDFSANLGYILAGIGAALIIAYFIGRKQFAVEIKAEEENLKTK